MDLKAWSTDYVRGTSTTPGVMILLTVVVSSQGQLACQLVRTRIVVICLEASCYLLDLESGSGCSLRPLVNQIGPL